MREAYLFQTMEKIRERLLLLVEKCPVELRNVIPTGFNNNIFWHIGHILTVTDGLVFVRSEEASRLPESYRVFLVTARSRPTGSMLRQLGKLLSLN